jgi:hypothetical protein
MAISMCVCACVYMYAHVRVCMNRGVHRNSYGFLRIPMDSYGFLRIIVSTRSRYEPATCFVNRRDVGARKSVRVPSGHVLQERLTPDALGLLRFSLRTRIFHNISNPDKAGQSRIKRIKRIRRIKPNNKIGESTTPKV